MTYANLRDELNKLSNEQLADEIRIGQSYGNSIGEIQALTLDRLFFVSPRWSGTTYAPVVIALEAQNDDGKRVHINFKKDHIPA